MTADVWSLVHAERQALVDDLAELTIEQWNTASLCEGWTVHDVAAHLVDNARATPWRLLLAMLRARLDFDRQNQHGVDREKGATPAETLDRLRAQVTSTCKPPDPIDSRLVEEVVHGEDIRRALSITHGYAAEAVERALRHQARTSAAWGGARQRVERVTLRPDDLDLVIGTGPAVTGSAVSILLAVSGRPARADLGGPGVALLGD